MFNPKLKAKAPAKKNDDRISGGGLKYVYLLSVTTPFPSPCISSVSVGMLTQWHLPLPLTCSAPDSSLINQCPSTALHSMVNHIHAMCDVM